jgi:hypothetical protein
MLSAPYTFTKANSKTTKEKYGKERREKGR